MKKIFAILGICLLLVGCGCTEEKAGDAVKDYLNQYKNLSDTVMTDLATLVDSEELNDDQKDVYKEVVSNENYIISGHAKVSMIDYKKHKFGKMGIWKYHKCRVILGQSSRVDIVCCQYSLSRFCIFF